jgi:CHASE3 domain sensor protein
LVFGLPAPHFLRVGRVFSTYSLFSASMSFAQRLLVGTVLAVLVAMGTAYYVWQQIEETQASVRRDDRAERIQTETDHLLVQFIGMETGARSYIITGDSVHLMLFARTVGDVALTAKQVRSLMQPLAPEAASILNFLDMLIDKKIIEANQAIAMRREQGIKIAANIIIKGKAANAADTLTTLIQRLQSQSRLAAMQQYQNVPTQYHDTAYFLLYGIGASVLILILSAFWAILAQHQALKPIVEGAEKLALGDMYHRIPTTVGAADVKPILAAVNLLGERLVSMQGKTRHSEDIYADIVHATPECIAVWRAVRNGYGQISDFECIMANNAWNAAYKRSMEYFTGKQMKSSLPDFMPLFDQCKIIVEQHQKLTITHPVEGKQYKLIASKMRDGLLLRLIE